MRVDVRSVADGIHRPMIPDSHVAIRGLKVRRTAVWLSRVCSKFKPSPDGGVAFKSLFQVQTIAGQTSCSSAVQTLFTNRCEGRNGLAQRHKRPGNGRPDSALRRVAIDRRVRIGAQRQTPDGPLK